MESLSETEHNQHNIPWRYCLYILPAILCRNPCSILCERQCYLLQIQRDWENLVKLHFPWWWLPTFYIQQRLHYCWLQRYQSGCHWMVRLCWRIKGTGEESLHSWLRCRNMDWSWRNLKCHILVLWLSVCRPKLHTAETTSMSGASGTLNPHRSENQTQHLHLCAAFVSLALFRKFGGHIFY